MATFAPRTDTFAPNDVEHWQHHFEMQGYCILHNLLPPATLQRAEEACTNLVHQLGERLLADQKIGDVLASAPFNERLALLCQSCPDQLPNLWRAELHQSPAFYDLMCHDNVFRAVRHLLSHDVDGIRIFPNYSCRPKTKSPLHTVTWHQDSGLRADGGPSTAPLDERVDAFGLGRVVNCWTPLVPATAENGAMKFIKGSQHRGILEHVFLGAYQGSAASGERLPDTVDGAQVAQGAQRVPAGTYMTGAREELIRDDIGTAIDVECNPGDVVLFSNILVHRGGVNTTEQIRWSFDWRFQDASKSTYRAEKGHVVHALTKEYDHVICRTGEEWARRSLT